MNVNMVDDEAAKKNVENKKKNFDYKPYDDAEEDEYGMVCIKASWFLPLPNLVNGNYE